MLLEFDSHPCFQLIETFGFKVCSIFGLNTAVIRNTGVKQANSKPKIFHVDDLSGKQFH